MKGDPSEAAKLLGRRGGLKGGRARAESMTATARSESARRAALARATLYQEEGWLRLGAPVIGGAQGRRKWHYFRNRRALCGRHALPAGEHKFSRPRRLNSDYCARCEGILGR